MKLNIVIAAFGACRLLSLQTSAATSPTELPLPLVGTGAHGHAYPGAIVPFGMVQLSPDTPIRGWDGSSGYHYSDSAIRGFSHTHLAGTGVGCLGDVLLMPTVGEVHLEAGSPGRGYTSRFAHADETATPGYYRVFLQDPKVTAELTATARCGFHKYTFPGTDQAHMILDLVHGVDSRAIESTLQIEGNNTVSGSRISEGWGGRRAVYFVMQFSKPFQSFGIEQDATRLAADTRNAKGRNVKAFFNYKMNQKEALLVRVGISGTGTDGARKNLAAEIPAWDFAAVKAAAVKQWQSLFDMVQVDTFDPHVRATFYANLYLCCQAPILFNDVDGSYRGLDHQNHPSAGFQNYTIFSLWDTYRAEHPLLTILQPGRVNDMVQSMLAEYRESGLHTTPIWPLWGNETWCMIGYHSVPVIVDAYLKGFRGFDAEMAYQAMRDTAMQDRNGLKSYKDLGYVESKSGDQATSKTIEYTFDDWSLARMAEALGHYEDAQMFYKRCANYRNLFDGTTRFFRGRKANGVWRSPFVANALVGDEYTEADAWQYAFGVQHDVPGLMALYGGDGLFIRRLDSLFAADSKIQTGIPDISGLIGQYSQGDEQCHHVAYLYNYAGAPYKTQERVRQVMATLFDDTPTGQCGNVDCGQMSAWYVFTALGFYPVNPVSGIYIIGSPVVTKAVLHLDRETYHGKTFTVLANNNSPKNIYVQSASLNGKSLARAWLTHQEITGGGTLRLVMGSKPNMEWGRAPEVRPPATMPTGFKYPELPAPASDKQVVLKLPIRVICGSDEPAGGFEPDPNMVDGAVNSTRSAVDTSVSGAAPAVVYQSERYGQDFAYHFAVPTDGKYFVRLHFAEVFDDGAGRRIENIELNGKPVLTNFDIFVAAGGMNKALVKEFHDVAPDSEGNIVIRISSPPTSPDRNAKISGIEVLPEGT
jgi:predicted alpha-1,2-mannosidase